MGETARHRPKDIYRKRLTMYENGFERICELCGHELQRPEQSRLTRKSSTTAGGSERGLEQRCFHNVERGIEAVSG
jgi:hypothetical protein